MRWKRFIFVMAAILIVLVVTPLTIIPFHYDLAKEIVGWIGAYSGISLIIAALIAAYPTFLQLEELKIATSRTKVDMIAGIQSALHEEKQRVENVNKLVDNIVQLARVKHHENINLTKKTCLSQIRDVGEEIAHKIDNIPLVTEHRVSFVRKTQEFCKHLEQDSLENPGDYYFTLLVNIGKELQDVVNNYRKANDEYRESLTKQIKGYELNIFTHDIDIGKNLSTHSRFTFWMKKVARPPSNGLKPFTE
jgi:hypothetical protein